MDATANDLPPKATFKVAGFPTIKLFKAGEKEVVDYSGDRSYESFIEFLDKNAINKVDVNASTPEEPTTKEQEPEQIIFKDSRDEL
jgi:protein disulfide-isomerase A1